VLAHTWQPKSFDGVRDGAGPQAGQPLAAEAQHLVPLAQQL
jgi:hypothetical protein